MRASALDGFAKSRHSGKKRSPENSKPFKKLEDLAKLLKAVENRHSGQAKRDPESRVFKRFWIPAPAPDPIRGSPE
jgi:hypothetical protein